MDPRLHQAVVDRLDGDGTVDDDVTWLVLAACEGPEALAGALGGATPGAPAPATAEEVADPPAVYLRAVAVEGFRGVGPRARLELEPGPGLTLVVGRNGSGKSSFAEALELCLTGTNRRWADRSAVWRGGWRNLHHPNPCAVSAELVAAGLPGPLTIRRTWDAGATDADAAATTVTGHPTATSIEGLGWSPALAAMRPFLPYNELARMFEVPSQLHDALAAILGLDELVTVANLLRDQRRGREKALKDVKDRVASMQTRLAGLEDERAAASRAALSASAWDLDAIELALGGAVDAGDPEGELALLSALANVQAPESETPPEALRSVADRLDAIAGTDAGRSLRLAEILQRGLDLHEQDGDCACPVCGDGRLDASWRASATEEAERLRAGAGEATAAHGAAREALSGAARSMDPEPSTLARADEVGLDADGARAAWADWVEGRTITDLRAMADHIERCGPPLRAALAALGAHAAAERERREDLWRPVARDLREWLTAARPAVDGAGPIKNLRLAETWVKGATDAIRRERFEPISAAATEHWETLRQGSSVTLESLDLAGSATQRRVDIAVAIDGSDGAALGVMSQGELCSLALCMFLPRATHDESPFRFVVIDDPVQSMDPAKVEGLARVLQAVAAHRQVVVLTHDDRLPESVRRLRIPARIVEVRRRTGSQVFLSPGLDPVEARLDDARAAARDTDLPASVASRVVPGLCRQAIEAGCAEAVRRRRLARGDAHAEVEERLGRVTGLYEWVALALFDDGGKESQGKVLSRLNNDNSLGPRTADAFKDCNAGAHRAHTGPLSDLVRDAGRLARSLSERA